MDNIGGAQAMIDHLYEQGHRRIALLTGPKGNFDSEQRLMGSKLAARRLGLSLPDHMIWTGAFTLESGAAALPGFLNSSDERPDAIFCFNDAMAIGALGELHRRGIVVPRDIAVAGYDNVEAAAHLSLTTVAAPMRLMGQLAARWAVDLATTNQRPQNHRIQVRLTVRNSSAGKGSSHVLPGAIRGSDNGHPAPGGE
jgi:DNA-binding LacI/PurR family transcriptional regulator